MLTGRVHSAPSIANSNSTFCKPLPSASGSLTKETETPESSSPATRSCARHSAPDGSIIDFSITVSGRRKIGVRPLPGSSTLSILESFLVKSIHYLFYHMQPGISTYITRKKIRIPGLNFAKMHKFTKKSWCMPYFCKPMPLHFQHIVI